MPTSSARQLSCSAPAKISDADAVCSLTITVSGAAVSGGPTARTARSSFREPVSVTTTVIPSAATQQLQRKLNSPRTHLITCCSSHVSGAHCTDTLYLSRSVKN